MPVPADKNDKNDKRVPLAAGADALPSAAGRPGGGGATPLIQAPSHQPCPWWTTQRRSPRAVNSLQPSLTDRSASCKIPQSCTESCSPRALACVHCSCCCHGWHRLCQCKDWLSFWRHKLNLQASSLLGHCRQATLLGTTARFQHSTDLFQHAGIGTDHRSDRTPAAKPPEGKGRRRLNRRLETSARAGGN